MYRNPFGPESVLRTYILGVEKLENRLLIIQNTFRYTPYHVQVLGEPYIQFYAGTSWSCCRLGCLGYSLRACCMLQGAKFMFVGHLNCRVLHMFASCWPQPGSLCLCQVQGFQVSCSRCYGVLQVRPYPATK